MKESIPNSDFSKMAKMEKWRKIKSLKDVNRICKYNRLEGTKIEGSVDALSSKIEKLGYIAIEEEGKEQFDKLNDIIFDENKSFPIISFGPQYIKDQKRT